jgi:hypothetical protein
MVMPQVMVAGLFSGAPAQTVGVLRVIHGMASAGRAPVQMKTSGGLGTNMHTHIGLFG